ncbi:hypothetical protein [Legionella maceachernii]|uniref:Uncharacterized protein n=1 Tax=Legionella maceachernii TaxID=466 RepID=A0A0W0VWD0_9GAMM|nr:hypothetical protein [Legionella maceachernii]KTD24396.1 hypothetical protein Lmac_2483 [Legionella maceachernii]SJZ67907.1 hypothetical protein SAMN02745128_00751 [Legionella maceachernii]SUP02094.1 Uncharacterised protein [Legionella maceachernii]
MGYIEYDEDEEEYYSTGTRPGNQNSPQILQKIAKRLTKYVLHNRDVCLTDLQTKFISKVKAGERFLSKENIDVAHHIAISRIIKIFVNLLNNPKSFKLKDFENFGDAICSTESPEDDKGRSTLTDFFNDIKNGCEPTYLCDTANEIIKMLNGCTRNLIPGHKSVNRSIGEAKDLHLMAQKGKSGAYKETAPSRRLSHFFSALPECDDYAPRCKETKNGKKLILSSSVDAKKDKSYLIESKSDFSYSRYGG